MKKLFLFCAALAVFTGCSKDADQSGFTAKDLEGKAFLSVGFVNGGNGTRATNTGQPGSEFESKVSKVTVLLFDDLNKCVGAVDFPNVTVGNGTTAAAPSDPQLVPAETKRVFVVINNAVGVFDFSTAEGRTWNDINAAINTTAAAVATDNAFVMSSAGTLAKGALTDVTVYKAASESTADVDAAKAEAKANAAEIKIDRMSAKVNVTQAAGFQTLPAGAVFTFQGWELSVTNKSIRLYSEIIPYTGGTTGAIAGIYRQDKNYLTSEQPANATEMAAAFNYLTNDPLSDVTRAINTNAYCLENTMEAAAQKIGVTTKAVIRAQYTPAGLTAAASYFAWYDNYYTLSTLKDAYAAHTAGSGLKVDLPIFLKKAGIYTDAAGDIDTFVAALTDAQFTVATGITGRFCAVRYYHESVCYYDVLIRHDQSVTAEMALGRYGVVRNNWYSLSLEKVSGPGTPWIPDPSDPDPTNPTDPETPDDAGNAYLSVQMTINPWTSWSQGVELN